MGKYLDSLKASLPREVQASNLINLNNSEQVGKLGSLGSQNENVENSNEQSHQLSSWWRLIFAGHLTKDYGCYPPATRTTVLQLTDAIDVLAIAEGPEGLQSPDQWGHWSESEAINARVRASVFASKGLDTILAEELACALVDRDRSGDDRRICYECRYLLYTCTQGLVPVGGNRCALHRCIKFIEDS